MCHCPKILQNPKALSCQPLPSSSIPLFPSFHLPSSLSLHLNVGFIIYACYFRSAKTVPFFLSLTCLTHLSSSPSLHSRTFSILLIPLRTGSHYPKSEKICAVLWAPDQKFSPLHSKGHAVKCHEI